MSKRSFEVHTYSPTATGDGSALANNTYQAIEANAASMVIDVSEIYIAGQATSSAVNIMQFRRSQSVATGPTAVSNATATDGFMKPFATLLAASAICCVTATTGPVPSTTNVQARLALGLNAFGGIVRWVAYPGEEWTLFGTTTANVTGSTLSAFTGGSVGAIGSHIIYEIT